MIQKEGSQSAIPHPVPVLGIEGDPRPRIEGRWLWREGVGAHELLMGDHTGDDRLALRLAQQRIQDLRRDSRLLGFSLGRRALPFGHAIWQLLALPFSPALSAPALWRDAEKQVALRVLEEAEGAIAILAWAPQAPFETWILPTQGREHFEHGNVQGVAYLLQHWLPRIQAMSGSTVDIVLVDGEPWRLELIPRLRERLLVEEISGMPVHGLRPEVAMTWLKP